MLREPLYRPDRSETSGLSICGHEWLLREVAAVDGPPPFEQLGIGGFLSPQRLRPDQTVVLDMADQLLRVGSYEEVMDLAVQDQQFATVPIERHAGGTLSVRGRFGSLGERCALLDTGAPSTEALAVDGAVAASEQTISLEGATLTARAIGVTDAIGVPVGSLPDESPDAIIGMDLCANSIVVIPPVPKNGSWLLFDC